MHRGLRTLALLTSLAVAAWPQLGAAAPFPQTSSQPAVLATAQAAIEAKRWPEAEAALKQLASAEPRWEYFDALAVAQFNQAHYADSIASYQRALDLGKTAIPAAAIGAMYTNIGNADVKLNKKDAAMVAFEKAAAVSPNPAVAYFNLCATMYNVGQMETKAVAACDNAIAADPKKADAYFIKGSMLFGLGTVQPNGKFKVSDAAVQALRQYLVLLPNGPHAADVNAMLDALK